jgi:uncharacterized damage-inducible protein DinB
MKNKEGWADDVSLALALAAKLEGEGQYNNAKLLRAAADSMTRRAGYERDLPSDKAAVEDAIQDATAGIARQEVGSDLVAALKRGAAAMAEGRLPLIDETPHPYVCRTCGHTVLGQPAHQCPSCGAWPATFQRFLPVYWLDELEPFAAVERLRQTPRDLATLLDGLPEEALSREPADGGWSVRHIVSHLRDAQGVLRARLKLLLEQDNPSLSSQAVFEWAAREEARPPTTQEILGGYRATRQEILATLETIPLKDWWCTGQHEEFGTVTIRQQVSYFAAHESTHLPQIERLLS